MSSSVEEHKRKCVTRQRSKDSRQGWSLTRIAHLATTTFTITVSHVIAVFCDRLLCLLLVFSLFFVFLSVFVAPLLAFERGHCYEPYLQNGNFTTTDPLYGVGAVVQFTCDPGHSLEQGPPVIECISARDPYWNDTEPLCKGNNDERRSFSF